MGTTANASAYYCLVYNYFTGSWTPPSSCPTSGSAPTGTTDNGDVTGYQYVDNSRPGSSHTATYTYDSLNRLYGAVAKDFSNNTFWSQTYTYDRWGNMTCSGTGLCTSMTYSSSNNNQLSAVGGASVTYDAAGNLMQDNSAPHSYQWDAEGRMRQIDSGTSAIVTTFNALGQRAYRQNSSNFSASYSYDPSGQFLGGYGSGWWNAEVPFGGRVLAEYANGSPAPVYFDHPNALGSGQQWTTAAGGSDGEVLFYPWGAQWGSTTNGYQLFASLLWYDPETDGYQTPNRYYIPRLGTLAHARPHGRRRHQSSVAQPVCLRAE